MGIAAKDNTCWLALQRIEGLGPVGQRKLLVSFSSVEKIFSAQPSDLRELGLRDSIVTAITEFDWKIIEADLAWLQSSSNHYLVTINDDAYPVLLREISDPPLVLFVYGCLDVLKSVQLGIVGSRNPDRAGRETAQTFARALANVGVTITSGLALGIDACGHTGALDVDGYTIAVLGNGLDMIYPSRHRELAEKIVRKGALVSEFPSGIKPIASNFPRRNRIISGMSTGILVIQAATRSGSLITARYAMEQGRDVFAIPGSIHNPLAEGCHALIKQGAKLVESVHDITEELHALSAVIIEEGLEKKSPVIEDLDEDCQLLLANISYDAVSIDRLMQLTGLTVDVILSMLLMLELRGLVVTVAGGLYMRV